MFDWLRNRFKSEADRERETITAYLDDALSGKERASFEARLRREPDLQAEVDSERQVKLLLRQMPRLRAPRNFVLDPAVYGRPAPRPLLAGRLYPALRAATVVASLLFAVSLTLNLATVNRAGEPQDSVAFAPAATESFAAEPAAAPAEEAVEEALAMDEAEEMAEAEVESAAAVAEEPMELAVEAEAVEAERAVIEEEAAADAPPTNGEGAPATAGGVETMTEAATNGGEEAEEALSPRPTATSSAARVATLVPTPSPVATPVPEIIAAAPEDAAGGEADSATVTTTQAPSRVDPIALLSIGLGLLTVLLLAATVIARLRIRR